MVQRGIPKSVSKKGLTVFPLRFSRLFMVWRVNDKLHLPGTIRSQRADHPVHGRTNEDQRYTKARIYTTGAPLSVQRCTVCFVNFFGISSTNLFL